MAVIHVLEDEGEATAAEVSTRVNEPISSTYRLLNHLQALDWVESGSARGRYRLGRYFSRIGGLVADLLDVRERALPYLRALREKTGLTSYLSVRRGTRAVCIERLTGRSVHSLEYRVGDMLPLNLGGAPMVLLAFLPAEERDMALLRIQGEENDRLGARGEALFHELDLIRERGWSASHGDVTKGVGAIGAPVFNHRGELVAAVSIGGIHDQVFDDSNNPALVLRCARAVSESMGLEMEGLQ